MTAFYIGNNRKVLLRCMCGCYTNQIHLCCQLCHLSIIYLVAHDTMDNLQ